MQSCGHLVMFPCSGCQARVTRGRGNTWSTRHVTFTSPPRDTCCSTGPLPGSGQSDVLLLSWSLTAAAHRTQRGWWRLSHPGRMSPRGSGTRLQQDISMGAVAVCQLELAMNLRGTWRKPLLGPSPGWKHPLALSQLRSYWDTMLNRCINTVSRS